MNDFRKRSTGNAVFTLVQYIQNSPVAFPARMVIDAYQHFEDRMLEMSVVMTITSPSFKFY